MSSQLHAHDARNVFFSDKSAAEIDTPIILLELATLRSNPVQCL